MALNVYKTLRLPIEIDYSATGFQVDPKQAIKTGALNIKPTRAICQIDQAYPLLLKAMRQSTNLTISVVHTDTDADGIDLVH